MGQPDQPRTPTTADLTWQQFADGPVTVYALEGSYAAKRAAAELREAKRIIAELTTLLAPAANHTDAPLRIYLTDPVESPAGYSDHQENGLATGAVTGFVGGEREVIVRVVQPDGPDEPLARPLTKLLVARWIGDHAAAASLLVEGIAGVVAARAQIGPTIAQTGEWVRTEIAEGRSVSIFERPAATDTASKSSARASSDNPAATSFVAYLIDAFGADSLRQFLKAFDPDRRDQAAITAYQRPLGALEEAWLGSLRQRTGAGAAFRSFFHHVGPLIKPYRWRLLEVFGYMLIGLTYSLALPLGGKYVVDTIIPSGEVQRLVLFSLALLAIYLLNAAISVRRSYVNNWVNQNILIGLQERMFATLQHLPHSFYGRSKIGDLMSRLSNDLQVVQQALSQILGVGVFLALRAILAAVTIVTLSPLLGGLVLAVVPFFALIYLSLRRRIQEASYAYQKSIGEVSTTAQESLSAQAVIKAFGLEERTISSYHSRLMGFFRATLRLIIIATLFETSIGLAVSMGQLLVLGVGGYLVIEGNITIGTLLAFIGLLPSLFEPIGSLSNLGQTVEKATGALDRVVEVLDEPRVITDKPDAVPLAPLAREIQFDNVTFGYDPGRPILHELAFVIPAGAQVAVVGPSGCGKSSMINLLLRFWDPEGGRVLLDGNDVRDVTLASVRGQIGLVFQDTFIFDTTVRENIAIGRPTATDAEIAAAAKAAQLESFVTALPAGYDTVLGERGVRMSGGQRQRLAIARALLRDPRLLILDEATSALDPQTESEIQQTLNEAAQGRTTISITHRLTSVVNADRIFVLDRGRLVEQGTHGELIATGGLYQRLYEEQTGVAGAAGPPRVDLVPLHEIPLFAGLPDRELASLAERLVLERYEAEADVVRQGDAGDKMYIISRGQVEVLVADEFGSRLINNLNDGDYFGEMALLTGAPRTATVRTTMQTELYSLARSDLQRLTDRFPAIRTAIEQTVANRQAALAMASSAGVESSAATRSAPDR